MAHNGQIPQSVAAFSAGRFGSVQRLRGGALEGGRCYNEAGRQPKPGRFRQEGEFYLAERPGGRED
jgi:hypothetical protein